MIILYSILGLVVAIILWTISVYNKLVRKRNLVAEGWSGVDVQLKRRTDLVPNLIESVKGYMQHEKSLLTEITTLRAESLNTADKSARAQVESSLSRSLGNLFAVAENYPNLKANETFLDLQRQLGEIEDQLQLARRYYNGTVRDLNTFIQTFPNKLVAQRFQFKEENFFQLENESERAVPKVQF